MKALLILFLIAAVWFTIGFFVTRWGFLRDEKEGKKDIVGDELWFFLFCVAFWPVVILAVGAEWFDEQKENKRVWFTLKK
jgi:hypothetical protein